MKKLLLTFLAALMFMPMHAQAATFKGEEEDSINIDTVVADDLYIGAGIVNVFSDITGDLFALTGILNLESKVTQDILALAGELNISGEVDDDVRAAAENLRVDSTIKGDLITAAGVARITKDGFVGGDAVIAAGLAHLGGAVQGDVLLAVGEANINGEIRGNLKLASFDKVTFGPDARIVGNLSYRSEEAMDIPEGVVGGEVVFKEIPKDEFESNLPDALSGFSLFSFLSTLFFGLFFIWLYRYFILNSAHRSFEATLKSLGVGFLVVILTPIAVLILLATAVGVPLALVTLFLWLVTLYMGKIMAAMLIGFKLVKVDNKSKFGRIFGSFFVGTLIYILIGLVPMFGWLINFLFILIALGGMTSHSIELHEQLRKKKLA